jgi:transposase
MVGRFGSLLLPGGFAAPRVFSLNVSPKKWLPLSPGRSSRLDSIVHHLGRALGGRPAASLARRLLMPVSTDTLLRTVRRRFASAPVKPTIIGIDDWAWKRGQRYGTSVCDLERRCIVDLLPDRGVATVKAWLKARPEISIISRDRGGGYRHAAARALPGALQIADRWHLMENASQAFLDAVRKSMRAIRQALQAVHPIQNSSHASSGSSTKASIGVRMPMRLSVRCFARDCP